MKKIGSLFKKIVIIYLVFFMLLANMSQCLGRAYDDSCGEYVADYATKFIEQYGGDSTYLATQEVSWSGGSFGNGTFKSCCTSGVKYMYELALGINLYDYGYSALASNNLNITSQYWDKIPTSQAKPGDILVKSGHVEMATSSGARDHADFGSTGSSSAVMHYNAHDTFTTAIRLKSNVDVNPNGKIAGAKSNYDEERDSIYGANGFIYQGVATLSGYESGGTLGKWLFDSLLKILDWVIGILTYLLRIVIVGWTVIVERVFIDGIVNSVTGINNTSEPENEDEEEQLEDIGDENNPDEYVSTGVQQVANAGGSTKLTTSSKANVTVENIVFNRVPILDINFFNFETALTTKRNEGNVFKPGTLIGNSGEGIEVVEAQIDKNGIIYILKTAIATWYYTFRVIAVAVMLLILIYLGIRMAFSTVAEGKAVYKEMLIGWITGFILLFMMHYIMYATITINEAIINIIVSTQVKLGGDEISLYETVRSKAYEIKASTGWAGTIMYLVLVYYSVRFLLIYLKRYFTVAILAILSSLVALFYAIEKINKKGKKAAVYGMWLKDFIYTVVLQSAHALIYVVFVGTALKLTEASLAGIMLSMVFLNFMMKNAEAILRKIMAFTSGPGDLMKDDIANIANATVAGMSLKKIASSYANGVNNVLIKPAANLVGSGLSHASDRVRNFVDSREGRQLTDAERQSRANISEIEKKKAEKEQEIKARREQQVKKALGVAGSAISGTLQTVGGIVGTIVEPSVGLAMLGKGVGSFIDASDKLRNLKGPKPISVQERKRYTFNGVKLADRRAANQLMLNLRRDNIDFTVDAQGRIKAGNNLRESRKYINKYVKKENLGANNGVLRTGLRFATGKALADKIAISESEVDVRDRALVQLYGKAIDKENELVREYKFARVKQDKLIASIAQKDEKLAAKLQAKQDKEMESAMLALMDPIPIEDIEAAIESYKSKGGNFDIGFGENKEGLLAGKSIDLEQKVQGISQELNRILEDKKSKVRVGDNFTNILKTRLMTVEELKAEKEEDNTHDRISGRIKGRRAQGVIDRNDPHSSQYAPQQVGTKSVEEIEAELRGKKNDILNEQTKPTSTPRTPIRMKLDENSDEIKELMNNPNSSEYEPHEVGTKSKKGSGRTKLNSNRDKTRELMNDPNSSRNAPKQGITAEESLSESIYKSARASGAVEIDSDIRVETLQPIMLKLIELQQLNTEAELLGQEPLYDIEEIIKMLKET